MTIQRPVNCSIYRSAKKSDTYLYLRDKDDFSMLPDQLKNILGSLTWVMDLALDEQKPLAQADVNTVIQSLHEQGYYLQLPPATF